MVFSTFVFMEIISLEGVFMQWISITIVAILFFPVCTIFLKNRIRKKKTDISDVICGTLALPITLALLLFLSLVANGTTSFGIFWGILK